MPRIKQSKRSGWVSRKVSIQIPDREENEDPITNNQLIYIRKLAPGIKIKGGLESLGKWQASAVIGQIKEQQETLEDALAMGAVSKPRKIKNLLLVALLLIIIYYIVKYTRG